MRLTCPGCGCHGSLEFFTSDELARRFSKDLSELPAGLNPSVVRRYVAMFRPVKMKGLVWERACKLLGDVMAMAQAGYITFEGRQYTASPTLINESMQQMLDKPGGIALPLKSHNYLFNVIARGSNPAATQVEEQAEQQKRHDSQARHRESESDEARMQRMREEAQRADARRAIQQGIKR